MEAFSCREGYGRADVRGPGAYRLLEQGVDEPGHRRILGPGLATSIFDAWMSAEFEGGRHANRVEKIEAIEG